MNFNLSKSLVMGTEFYFVLILQGLLAKERHAIIIFL